MNKLILVIMMVVLLAVEALSYEVVVENYERIIVGEDILVVAVAPNFVVVSFDESIKIPKRGSGVIFVNDGIIVIRVKKIKEGNRAFLDIYKEDLDISTNRSDWQNNGWCRKIQFSPSRVAFFTEETVVKAEPGDEIASQFNTYSGKAVLRYAAAFDKKIKLSVLFEGYRNSAHAHHDYYNLGWLQIELKVGDEVVIGAPLQIKNEYPRGRRIRIKFLRREGIAVFLKINEE